MAIAKIPIAAPARVAITDIVRDERVQARPTASETVADYTERTPETSPPVVVFRVAGSLILADGWHRVAAAEERGDKDIACDVREGTIEDAMVFGMLANVDHGRPYSRAERNAIIRRLWNLPHKTYRELGRKPPTGLKLDDRAEGWTRSQIATVMNCPGSTVRNVINGDALWSSGHTSSSIPPTVASAIARAPEGDRQRIADQYERHELRDENEVSAAVLFAREAAGGKPAPASAHEVMTRVHERNALNTLPPDHVPVVISDAIPLDPELEARLAAGFDRLDAAAELRAATTAFVYNVPPNATPEEVAAVVIESHSGTIGGAIGSLKESAAFALAVVAILEKKRTKKE